MNSKTMIVHKILQNWMLLFTLQHVRIDEQTQFHEKMYFPSELRSNFQINNGYCLLWLELDSYSFGKVTMVNNENTSEKEKKKG